MVLGLDDAPSRQGLIGSSGWPRPRRRCLLRQVRGGPSHLTPPHPGEGRLISIESACFRCSMAQPDPHQHAARLDRPRNRGRARSRRQPSQPGEKWLDLEHREVQLDRLVRIGDRCGIALDPSPRQPDPHPRVSVQIPPPGIAGGYPHLIAPKEVGDWRAESTSASPACPLDDCEPAAPGPVQRRSEQAFHDGIPEDQQPAGERSAKRTRLGTAHDLSHANRGAIARTYSDAATAVAARIAASRP